MPAVRRAAGGDGAIDTSADDLELCRHGIVCWHAGGGPGAFMIVAEDDTAFASAILSKLLLEIAGETEPDRLVVAAAP